MKKKNLSLILVFVSLVLILSGCKPKQANPISKTGTALNTSISIALYDSTDTKILDEAFSLIYKYDQMFSRTNTTGEIYKLNETGTKTVSDDTLELLKMGLKYSEESDGAFDISVEPLSALWNFTSDNPKVPESSALKEALSHVNYKNISIIGNEVKLADPEGGIDLGAIAKGYIGAKVEAFLKSKGVNSAIINLGGNIVCVGSKPDGSPFTVGLQDPFKDRNEFAEKLSVSNKSVVTSGTYERFFEENGKKYHHILNTSTGFPYENGIAAVTIVCDDASIADALSTLVYTKGIENGIEYINSLENTECMIIDNDNNRYYSEKFKDYITK